MKNRKRSRRLVRRESSWQMEKRGCWKVRYQQVILGQRVEIKEIRSKRAITNSTTTFLSLLKDFISITRIAGTGLIQRLSSFLRLESSFG
jgi:hypothetical protein